MISYIRENRFLFIAVCAAILFWFLESVLHHYIFDEGGHFEFIPHDANELWMRSFIFVLIIGVGYFAQREIKAQKKAAKEKILSLQALINSVNDISGNTLSLMSHHCDEFIKSEKFDKKSATEMKNIIEETFTELKKLSSAKNLKLEEKHAGYFKMEVTQPNNDRATS